MAGKGGTAFHHPVSFWLGSAAVTLGVVLHLPMYLGARDMGYRVAGMPTDGPMMAGMALILVGLAATLHGLVPSLSHVPTAVSSLRVKALDDARLSAAHVGLLLVAMALVRVETRRGQLKDITAEELSAGARPGVPSVVAAATPVEGGRG